MCGRPLPTLRCDESAAGVIQSSNFVFLSRSRRPFCEAMFDYIHVLTIVLCEVAMPHLREGFCNQEAMLLATPKFNGQLVFPQ